MTLNFKLPLLLLGFCALLCAPRPSFAIYMTAQELEQGCMAQNNEDVAFCLGYIAGVIDYHVMMQSLGTAPATDFCLPKQVSVQQAGLAVMAYMAKTPQNGAFIAAPSIMMALHATYPCAVKKKKKARR